MATALAFLLVGGVLIAGLATAATRPQLPWTLADRWGLTQVRDSLDGGARTFAADFGRIPAAVLAYVTGIGAVVLVLWPVGLVCREVLQPIDDAVLGWAGDHQSSGLTSVMDVLTQMGNRPIIKPVTLAAILVVFLIRRQRRWVVPVVFLGMFLTEYYFQNILEYAIHRADPPTAGGNFPSGGCARLILTYGLLVWFLLRERRQAGTGELSRGVTFGWFSVVAAAGVLEAYSRTYLMKHWVTDTVAGLLFGAMLLAIAIAVVTLLDRPGRLVGRSAGDGVPAGATDRHRTVAADPAI